MKKQTNSDDRLKKYQQQKFDDYKEFTNLDLRDNDVIISLKADSVYDILSEYSVKDNLGLNPAFIHFLSNQIDYIPIEYDITLNIQTINLTKREKEMIAESIHKYYKLKEINITSELEANKAKSKAFTIVGVIAFVILFTLELLMENEVVFSEILSFIASFTVWEGIELILFEQDDIKETHAKYKNMANSKIVFDKDNGTIL